MIRMLLVLVVVLMVSSGAFAQGTQYATQAEVNALRSDVAEIKNLLSAILVKQTGSRPGTLSVPDAPIPETVATVTWTWTQPPVIRQDPPTYQVYSSDGEIVCADGSCSVGTARYSTPNRSRPLFWRFRR